ncbi:hypothetical protein OCK74_13120 [Chitinophagaceae bacterium LB-8]|uniref:Uncharacterized protein n=1 Tax=Paraflavisolibacter caeni TaxID=2982496 RepID=A0A9X3BII6_9BACT|nr:hypothetical protein [Paraflavisolibacter caeni]MCU7550058.1 hypothetical protein [Paraflavisolibacter caeni]
MQIINILFSELLFFGGISASGVFDIDAGKRFMLLMMFDEDKYASNVKYRIGKGNSGWQMEVSRSTTNELNSEYSILAMRRIENESAIKDIRKKETTL